MGQYLPILILGILAAIFGGVSLVMNSLLSPARPTKAQTAPYECGIIDATEPPQRFHVRFYLVAMIFIIFDIELVFLYPFAMVHDRLGAFGVFAVAEFAVIVFGAFLYLIGSGALEWGPAKQVRRNLLAVDANRSTTSTVRRVGLEGRDDELVGNGTESEAA